MSGTRPFVVDPVHSPPMMVGSIPISGAPPIVPDPVRTYTRRTKAAPAPPATDLPRLQIQQLAPVPPSSLVRPTLVPSSSAGSTQPESPIVESITPVSPNPSNPVSGSTYAMTTRQRNSTRRPKKFPDHVTYLSTNHHLPSSTQVVEPTSFTQANTHPKRHQAMAHELNALAKNGTWVLMPPHPNYHVIRCK